MTTSDPAATVADPQHTFLGIPELMARYGRKKTTICALVKQPDFPGEAAPRRWRLDHVMAYEQRAATRRPEVSTAPAPTTLPVDDDRRVEVEDEGDDILASRRRPRKAA